MRKTLIAALAAGAFFISVKYFLDLPIVQKDPDGVCVQVLSPLGDLYCSGIGTFKYRTENVGYK